MTATQNIETLRVGVDAFGTTAQGLSDADLHRRSGADEWEVHDVLSHIGSGAEIMLATVDGALEGQSRGLDANHEVWERWNAMSPRGHLDQAGVANELLVRRLEELDAATRESLMIDVGYLPEPVTLEHLVAMRISELTLHRWDVDVALDAGATLAPEGVDVMLDLALDSLGWVARPSAQLGGRVIDLDVRYADRGGGVRLRLGERAEVIDTIDAGGAAGEAAVLTIPVESWLRLFAGRLKEGHVPTTVTVSGAITLGDLRRIFPGY